MCTLTWLASGAGYELFFSRDEKRVRAAALGPELHSRGGRRWIAPRDPEGGGTWIGVNDAGLTIALLNGYLPADATERSWTSRGLLVDALLDAADGAEAESRLRQIRLDAFRSFVLVALEPSEEARVARWDTRELACERRSHGHPPICSSSFDPIGASRARAELLGEWAREHGGLDEELLARFHASHLPQRGPLSPCMHRDDAATQSLTRIRVTARDVALKYGAGAPCRPEFEQLLELPRRSSLA